MWHWPHVTTVDRAILSSDGGAESLGETLTRLLLVELGLGPIQTQFELRDATGRARCDMRVGRHVFEFDGFVKLQPVREGGFPFLLLQWGPSRDPGHPVNLPLNRTGDLIHIGSHCDAFEPMVDRAVSAGATVLERTRAQFPAPALQVAWEGDPHGWVFVLDPNGVQIEIVGPHVP